MNYSLGVAFSFLAFFCWGFGDFFTQKCTRAVGSIKTLFYIGFFGLAFLSPFVWQEIPRLDYFDLLLLLVLTVIVFFTAWFDFEALRQGKIAVIEAVMGFELPITVGLSLGLIQEKLSSLQLVLILLVFCGIVLATRTAWRPQPKRKFWEKGAILAGIGSICMALTNFLVGIASRQTSPLLTLWFTHSVLAGACLIYFLSKKEVSTIVADVKKNPQIIISAGLLDNIAWLAYASAMTLIPISIATTISESYIALAILLGLAINREKIRLHQGLGILLAVGGTILLAGAGG